MKDADRVEFEWLVPLGLRLGPAHDFPRPPGPGRAEEVTQDAFVRLYERWRGVAAIEYPEAWVRQVAIRAAVRRARRERFIPVVRGSRRPPPRTGPRRRPGAGHGVPSAPAAGRRGALLPRGPPVDEVARLLGVSSSTVKQHLFRARGTLAAVLGEAVDDPPATARPSSSGGR